MFGRYAREDGVWLLAKENADAPPATAPREIELSIDQDLKLTFALVVARTMEPVTVVATESPLIDPSKTSLGRTITARQLGDLPLLTGVRG